FVDLLLVNLLLGTKADSYPETVLLRENLLTNTRVVEKSRLWVLNTTLFESWEIVGPYPSWWVFNLLLLLIQGLNCFWSYLIVKIACKAISKGKVSKDDRSDIESSSDEEDSEPPGKSPHTATTTNGTSGTNGYLLSGPCSMDD
ncbi:Ceramide synthase 6, partial [Camelus dromedarius]